MEVGNHKQAATILKQYKFSSGEINFGEIFKIPKSERLPALYEKDFLKTTAVLVSAISTAFEKLNLKKKDYGAVVNDIAEDILDNYHKDNLTLEDLMLFLQKLCRGEYGNIEEVSLARFNNLFCKYLDERWDEGIRIRDEKHDEYKTWGDNNHFERSNRVSPIDQELHDYRKKIEIRKDEAALLKRENEILKQQRDF